MNLTFCLCWELGDDDGEHQARKPWVSLNGTVMVVTVMVTVTVTK